jgi:hypothetical protein
MGYNFPEYLDYVMDQGELMRMATHLRKMVDIHVEEIAREKAEQFFNDKYSREGILSNYNMSRLNMHKIFRK